MSGAAQESSGGISESELTKLTETGFEPEVIDVLSGMRREYRLSVEYLNQNQEERRLEFAKWLFEHGKLDKEFVEDQTNQTP